MRKLLEYCFRESRIVTCVERKIVNVKEEKYYVLEWFDKKGGDLLIRIIVKLAFFVEGYVGCYL